MWIECTSGGIMCHWEATLVHCVLNHLFSCLLFLAIMMQQLLFHSRNTFAPRDGTSNGVYSSDVSFIQCRRMSPCALQERERGTKLFIHETFSILRQVSLLSWFDENSHQIKWDVYFHLSSVVTLYHRCIIFVECTIYIIFSFRFLSLSPDHSISVLLFSSCIYWHIYSAASINHRHKCILPLSLPLFHFWLIFILFSAAR